MEAPNKVYLHEEDFTWIYTQPSSTIYDDIEYIRKDTLLEWAKEGAEHYKKLMEDYKDDHVFAASFGAYNAFIEKLNKI